MKNEGMAFGYYDFDRRGDGTCDCKFIVIEKFEGRESTTEAIPEHIKDYFESKCVDIDNFLESDGVLSGTQYYSNEIDGREYFGYNIFGYVHYKDDEYNMPDFHNVHGLRTF